MLWTALATLKRHWFIFGCIFLVYLAISVLLVKGVGNTVDITNVRNQARELFQGGFAPFLSSITVMGALLNGTGNAASEAAGAYQSILLILFSLISIWTLRQVTAGEKISVRDAFYKSTYPLIPFLLVLLAIVVQMLPSVLAAYIYQLAIAQDLAVTTLEKVLWILLSCMLVLWSLYMVTSSIFAIYIATLPDMRPMQALKSARELVRHRRWTVMRKVIFMPFALLIILILGVLPFVLFLPFAAEWMFYTISLALVVIMHAYMYTLYRELLK